MAALNAADYAPLSVVIVNVGGGGDCLSGMKKHEAERQRSGRVRDNVRFVDYVALKRNRDRLREAALNDIPAQLEAYFRKHDIYPEPEPCPDEIAVQPYQESEDIEVPIQITEGGDVTVVGEVTAPPEQKPQKPTKPQKQEPGAMKQALNFGRKAMGSKQGRRHVGRLKRRLRGQAMKMVKNTLGGGF